jgi:hypothetical protein
MSDLLAALLHDCDEFFKNEATITTINVDCSWIFDNTVPDPKLRYSPFAPLDPARWRSGGSLVCMKSNGRGCDFIDELRTARRGRLLRCKLSEVVTDIFRVGEVLELQDGVWRISLLDAECFRTGRDYSSYRIDYTIEGLTGRQLHPGVITDANAARWTNCNVDYPADSLSTKVEVLARQNTALYNLVKHLVYQPEGGPLTSAVPRQLKRDFNSRKRPLEDKPEETNNKVQALDTEE